MTDHIESEPPLASDEEIAEEERLIQSHPNVYRECALRFISEIDRLLAFIIAAENKSLAAMAIAFAFGRTQFTEGKSQVDIAKEHGVKRATVSRMVKVVQSRFGWSILGINPMPGQRSRQACKKFSTARKNICKTN